MSMQQCPNGHFFDPSTNAQCPHCQHAPAGADSDHTMPLEGGYEQPHRGQESYGETVAMPVFSPEQQDIRQCTEGHRYDASQYAQCPYCASASEDVNPNRTVPLDGEYEGFPQAQGPVFGATIANNVHDAEGHWSGGVTQPAPNPPVNSGVTISFPKKHTGFDPVVGWLVCVEGKARGRDYHIRSGNNNVGRGGGVESVDVQIAGDDTISKSGMARVTYDDKTKSFYVIAGTGRNLVRLNNKLLPAGSSRELHAYDRILLGMTTLMFVPLCGEAFDWT